MKVTLTGLLYRPQMSPQSQKSLVYLKHLINNLVCLPLYKYRTIPSYLYLLPMCIIQFMVHFIFLIICFHYNNYLFKT